MRSYLSVTGRKNSISQWFDIFIDNSNSGEKGETSFLHFISSHLL